MLRGRLAAVVVWYNPVDKEINNIYSYINSVEKIYIVDNSKDAISNKEILDNKKIKYLPNYDNLGIASALNIAVKKATTEGFSWLLTMDQDTCFTGNSMQQFLQAVPNIDLSRIGIITPWHKTRLKDPKPEQEIDYPEDIMTSGNLLQLKVCQELGGFYEWLFIDGVDIDYCFRMRKQDYKIMRINTIELLHNLGDIRYIHKFNRDILITNHNYIRRYYIARNYLYIKKMYSEIDPYFCDINARQRRWIIKIILFEKDKYRKIKSIILGKLDYLRGIKGRKDNL